MALVVVVIVADAIGSGSLCCQKADAVVALVVVVVIAADAVVARPSCCNCG